MTRRELLASTIVLPTLRFPGAAFHDYSRCLPDYLSSLAAEATRKRDAMLARLTTRAAIEARQKQVRETLWRLIGGQCEQTPLNAKTTGSFERDQYRVDKLIYESRPGLFVSANLYVPHGAGPFPGVLFQSGHYWGGKAHSTYQRCCQGLAQLGFVVLAFDPMGQGERINYLMPDGKGSRLPDCDSEHTTPGKQMILFGDTATRFQLWDAIRSLDYLLSLPEVDKKRVGATGHSGGGTLTMLLAATDERLTAAAVSMGNMENLLASPFRPPGATDDAEQDFVNAAEAGFDRWDLFYPFAPKPMIMWPSDRDFYATYSPDYLTNGWSEYQKLKRAYEVLGRSEQLSWADTPLPHALAYDSRMRVYHWMLKWLKHENQPLKEEPTTTPEKESDLWATESGSVVRSLQSATPFSLNRKRAVGHGGSVPALPGLSRMKVLSKVTARGVTVEAIEIASDTDVWLPVFAINRAAAKPMLIVLDPLEKERLWFPDDVDRVVPEDSCAICAVDVRGVGALRPGFSPGAAGYEEWHEQEENYAWISLFLGKPLAMQRARDIVATVRALGSGRPIYVAAAGKLTVPAIFAASVEPKIQGLYLSGGLVSFQNLVESEDYHHPFANFVPGLLTKCDLPDLVNAMESRKVALAGTVDASGQTMTRGQVSEVYHNAAITDHAAWTVEALMKFAS